MAINDGGGSAFPSHSVEQFDDYDGPKRYQVSDGGMSLRDYFAAHIVAAILASARVDGIQLGDADSEAETAYAWADAMLKARTAQPEGGR